MNLMEKKERFEKNKNIYESAKLTFHGVDGFDVYNASIPFKWDGKDYIFGRVERRHEWSRSWVRLFKKKGKDDWELVPDSMIYQLEDPYISIIDGNLVMGGSHVRMKSGELDTFYAYFYKGKDIDNLYYFTTGPDYMKDIRLVEMPDKKIGVFSRPRSEEIRKKFGSESMVGFTTINSLDELTDEVIENAPYIPDLFGKDEWGGCNQAYYLDSGLIGVIGHKSYKQEKDGITLLVYINVSFVFDPVTFEIKNEKIIGTRSCYPEGPSKLPELADCVFSSGIVMRPDGKADLYSGVGDTSVGRIVIDYPFEGYGNIIDFS